MKKSYSFLSLVGTYDSTLSGALRARASWSRGSSQKNIALWMILLVLSTLSGMARAQVTVTLVSVGARGVQGNDTSVTPIVSADGRFVVFVSNANNLIPGDTNGEHDVFVKNMETGEIVRVSESAEGEQANASSSIISTPSLSISADGRFVAFDSEATNLTEVTDTNNARDVFVKNMDTGEVVRVSEDVMGVQANTGSYPLVGSLWPSISADGRFVAFHSSANNLVPGNTNDESHIFVKNVETGEIIRVSEDEGGVQANRSSLRPSISADGRFVAFASDATNLVADADTNNVRHVFVKNLETGEVVRVSENAGGVQADRFSASPSISFDGRFVAFDSFATNLTADASTNDSTDVFVKNMVTGEVIRVSENAKGVQGLGNGLRNRPNISADGRFVAFESSASNLVPGDNCGVDVYVKNVQTGEIILASEGLNGTQASHYTNDGSLISSISADGRFVAFGSASINLLAEDTNGEEDVFLAEVVWPDASTSRLNLHYSVYTGAAAEVFWDRFIDNSNVLYEVTRNGELIGLLDTLSVFQEDLQPSVQYTYTVSAIDNNGNRLATDTISFTTNCFEPPRDSDLRKPSAPENLNFAVYSKTAAEVFWDRSSDDGFVQGYEITRNGQFVGIIDALSLFDDDFIPGVSYTYTITAIDNDGERSASSSIRLTTSNDTQGSLPSAPNLQSAVYSNTAAELFWERATDDGLVIGYEVIRNSESRGILDVLSVFDNDLTPGVEYLYEITAVDNDGNRSATSRIRVTSGGPDAGPAPADRLRVLLYSSSAAELFWERASEPGLRYEIERDGAVLATTDGTSYFDDALLPSRQLFEYSVVTIDTDNLRSTAATITLGR